MDCVQSSAVGGSEDSIPWSLYLTGVELISSKLRCFQALMSLLFITMLEKRKLYEFLYK